MSAKARHPIHVAVMRLFKPPFASEEPPSSTLRSDHDLGNTFALSGLLALPETPGKTYLGQHFNAFVRITNTHSRPLKSVKLTVELVTPRVRHVFKDKRTTTTTTTNNSQQPVELPVDGGLDIVIDHLLVEQGTHRLRVTVSYVWPETNVSDTCVKQYPVKVERPISVNLRTRKMPGGGGPGVEDGTSTTLVEAQLQNTTSENVLLDTVRFVPNEGFQATDLGRHMCAEDHSNLNTTPGLALDEIGQVGRGAPVPSAPPSFIQSILRPSSLVAPSTIVREPERLLLRPAQVHRYLYAVTPVQKNTEGGNTAGSSILAKKYNITGVVPPVPLENKVGRISMVWKTTMGETARLQTAMIERDVPNLAGLKVALVDCPTRMVLGQRYRLKGVLTNYTTKDTRAKIDFGTGVNGGGLVVCGKSCRLLECVKGGGGCVGFELDVMALEAGLQRFGGKDGGVVVENLSTGECAGVEELASVFVVVVGSGEGGGEKRL